MLPALEKENAMAFILQLSQNQHSKTKQNKTKNEVMLL